LHLPLKHEFAAAITLFRSNCFKNDADIPRLKLWKICTQARQASQNDAARAKLAQLAQKRVRIDAPLHAHLPAYDSIITGSFAGFGREGMLVFRMWMEHKYCTQGIVTNKIYEL
jgi:hypothetical protein